MHRVRGILWSRRATLERPILCQRIGAQRRRPHRHRGHRRCITHHLRGCSCHKKAGPGIWTSTRRHGGKRRRTAIARRAPRRRRPSASGQRSVPSSSTWHAGCHHRAGGQRLHAASTAAAASSWRNGRATAQEGEDQRQVISLACRTAIARNAASTSCFACSLSGDLSGHVTSSAAG